MRHRVFWPSMLILAFSLFLLKHRYLGLQKPVERLSRLTAPITLQPATKARTVEFAARHNPFPAIPEWESKFWEIANAPLWDQGQLFDDVVAHMPDDQIRPALDMLLSDYSDSAQIFIILLVKHWATKSPTDAAQWISQLPKGDTARRLYSEVAQAWAQQNLDAALDWVQQLPPSENQIAAKLSLANEAANQKPLTALKLLADLPPNDEYVRVLSYATQQWAKMDNVAAVAWVKQWPKATLRGRMLGQIAVNLGVQNPSAAAEMIAAELENENIPDKDIITVVRFWAISAPVDAKQWVSQLPDGPLHEEAVTNLVEIFQQDNFAMNGLEMNN